MMDIDDPLAVFIDEAGAEDLMITGKDKKIDLFFLQKFKFFGLLDAFIFRRDGQYVKPDVKFPGDGSGIGMVTDDQRDDTGKMPGLFAVQKVIQAMQVF